MTHAKPLIEDLQTRRRPILRPVGYEGQRPALGRGLRELLRRGQLSTVKVWREGRKALVQKGGPPAESGVETQRSPTERAWSGTEKPEGRSTTR